MFFFKKTPSISTWELEQKLSNKPMIIDVREPFEFSSGHIPGAINIPLGKITEYKPNGPIFVICQSGARSQSATSTLISHGFDATNVRGGMNSWPGRVV